MVLINFVATSHISIHVKCAANKSHLERMK